MSTTLSPQRPLKALNLASIRALVESAQKALLPVFAQEGCKVILVGWIRDYEEWT